MIWKDVCRFTSYQMPNKNISCKNICVYSYSQWSYDVAHENKKKINVVNNDNYM